jgi:hypothetical protein
MKELAFRLSTSAQDGTNYFDHHHTPDDTLYAIDRADLRKTSRLGLRSCTSPPIAIDLPRAASAVAVRTSQPHAVHIRAAHLALRRRL